MSLDFSSLDEYEEIASSNSFFNTIKSLAEYIHPEQVCRSVFINNLPLDISKEHLLKYLEIFNLVYIPFNLE